MISIIAVASALVFDLVASHYDASISVKGFAKGYEEANENITWLFKTKKPSYTQLSIYNDLFAVFVATPGFCFPGPAVLGACIAILLADGGKHLLAVRTWKNAFATDGASLIAAKTIWQKFLGL